MGKFYNRDLTEPSALLYETCNSLAQKWLRFTYRDHGKLVFTISPPYLLSRSLSLLLLSTLTSSLFDDSDLSVADDIIDPSHAMLPQIWHSEDLVRRLRAGPALLTHTLCFYPCGKKPSRVVISLSRQKYATSHLHHYNQSVLIKSLINHISRAYFTLPQATKARDNDTSPLPCGFPHFTLVVSVRWACASAVAETITSHLKAYQNSTAALQHCT